MKPTDGIAAVARREGSPGSPAYMATYQRLRRQRVQAAVMKAKTGPCLDCGGTFPPAAMDLHHRDPLAKSFTISASKQSVGFKKLAAEIAKCDLLCANCHRIRHSLGGPTDTDPDYHRDAPTPGHGLQGVTTCTHGAE